MSTSEIMEKLIGKIRQTNDEDLLNELYRILQIGTDDKTYMLSDKQLGLVREAEEQIKRGDVLSDEEADKEIDEWLDEKWSGLALPAKIVKRFCNTGKQEISPLHTAINSD